MKQTLQYTSTEPTGVVQNDSAVATAKHAALHKYGHDKVFPPPSPDDANTGSNKNIFWMRLITLANITTSNRFEISRKISAVPGL